MGGVKLRWVGFQATAADRWPQSLLAKCAKVVAVTCSEPCAPSLGRPNRLSHGSEQRRSGVVGGRHSGRPLSNSPSMKHVLPRLVYCVVMRPTRRVEAPNTLLHPTPRTSVLLAARHTLLDAQSDDAAVEPMITDRLMLALVPR